MRVSPRPAERAPASCVETHVQDMLRWAEARPVMAEAIAERWDEIYLDHELAVGVWDTLRRRSPEGRKIVAEVIATLRPSLAVLSSPKHKTRQQQREQQ